jgi:hypothetical protein
LQVGFAKQRSAAAVEKNSTPPTPTPPITLPGIGLGLTETLGATEASSPLLGGESKRSRFAGVGASIISSTTPSSPPSTRTGSSISIGAIPLGAMAPSVDVIQKASIGYYCNVTLLDCRGESPLSYLATLISSLPVRDITGKRASTAPTTPSSSSSSSSTFVSSNICSQTSSSSSSPSPSPAASTASSNKRHTNVDGEGIGIEDAGEKLLSWQLGRLLSTSFCSDITFLLDDNSTLKAHRAILGARSPVFEAMFRHSLKGGGFQESTAAEIPVEHTSAPIFRYVMNYIYTGTIGASTEPNITLGILRAADEYSIPGLRLAAEHRLFNYVNGDTLHEILVTTQQNPKSLLRFACFEYIIRRYR